jgi:hypothetical protein
MRQVIVTLAVLTALVKSQSTISSSVLPLASGVFVLPVVYVTTENAPAATSIMLAGTATVLSDPSATNIFDSAEALEIALSSTEESVTTAASDVAERAVACVPQPTGISHTSTPDSAAGFVSDSYYHDQALSASTPSGWVRAFTGLNASNSADTCLGFTLLPSYDVQACASRCATLPSCDSINIYFERDPSTSIDNSTCTNPAGVTNVKCVFWKGAVGVLNANNFGQKRAEFQVVVAGSSGYMKSAFAASLPVEPTTTSSSFPTATHAVDIHHEDPVSRSTRTSFCATQLLATLLLGFVF